MKRENCRTRDIDVNDNQACRTTSVNYGRACYERCISRSVWRLGEILNKMQNLLSYTSCAWRLLLPGVWCWKRGAGSTSV